MARPREKKPTARGRKVLAVIDKRGLSIEQAAAEMGVGRATLEKMLYAPDEAIARMSIRTASKITRWVGLPRLLARVA